jgi:molybdopterin converting factor subunit 1
MIAEAKVNPIIERQRQTFKVLYFASAKEATGLSSETLPLPTITEPASPDPAAISVQQLFAILEARHPKLKEKKILSSVAVAVNLEYVDIEEGQIKDGDEVAIIPPVSGG